MKFERASLQTCGEATGVWSSLTSSALLQRPHSPLRQARKKSPMIPPEGRGSFAGGGVNSLRRDSGKITGFPPCEPQ